MTELLTLAILAPPGRPLPEMVKLAQLAGRLGFGAVHVHPDGLDREEAAIAQLTSAAAPALVVLDPGTEALGVVRVNDPAAVAAERERMDAEGIIRPLVVAVPMSIGRTLNEATARADREPRFDGEAHPAHTGIFGTFEQAQEQVLALAAAGADTLLVDVPAEEDIADVLAQVKALVVGATPALLARHREQSGM